MIQKPSKPQYGTRKSNNLSRDHPRVSLGKNRKPIRSIDKKDTEQKATNDSKQRQKGKYAERYKYIRFVERKKVLRKMRQLQLQLIKMEGDVEKEKLEANLTELRRDLMYVEKFPSNEKYISLFPSEGALSEECIKKQNEIREMIVKKTANADKRENQRAKMDVIKNDDFFASPEQTSAAKPKTAVTTATPPSRMNRQNKKSKGPETAHPSWDAKKNNQRLTGSIADQKFEGSRLVFNDSDNE